MNTQSETCTRCGTPEVRALLDSLPVCGGCIDSHGGVVPAERIALDRTPDIERGFLN